MAIGVAVQRGSTIYIYDEKGIQIASIISTSRPTDGLIGYTLNVVNVKMGGVIYTYNEKGIQIWTVFA